MQERSGATCHMAMPQCCYLAKGAKQPSHTTNTIKFDRIPFDPCNSIKRFDLSPFDQKNSTYLQPPPKFFFSIRYHRSSSSIKCHVYHHVGGRRHTPVVCNEKREPHTSHYTSRPVTKKNNQQTTQTSHYAVDR